MARREYNQKMNLNLSGTSFTDETHINVGASSFYLDHDFFMDDDTSGDVLVIRDAAAGGGTLLVRDTDYSVSNQDTYLTTETGKNVYSTVTVTNAAYQATTLYFSGKYVADSVDKEDIGRITWQYEAVSASATLAPTTYTTYGCTAGTNGIKLTLPAVSMAYTNLKLDFIKLDDTNSAVMIDGSGAETINGLASIFLIEQYQKISIMCTGTAWIILQGTLMADSGGINCSSWNNRHLGLSNCAYDNKSTSFQIGEIIKEATSNNTGIVMADSGTVLTLWKVTGSGYWTNDRVITGQTSGCTADVNNAGTSKNTDYNFYHGFGKGIDEISYKLMLTLAATYSQASALDIQSAGGGTAHIGLTQFQVDSDNFKIQTMANSFSYAADATGNETNLSGGNDYSYRLIAKLVI